MAETLAELREAIDTLDRQLLLLLNQRAELACRVGELKRSGGEPIFRPEREAQVIADLQRDNQGPLKKSSLAPIWREIMSACRALEAPVTVAYLGPAGTFSEEAALSYFGSSAEHMACASIDEVFQRVSSGGAAFGVVPVENSTEGAVARSLDLFLQSPLVIVGEQGLQIRHNLLRKEIGLSGITTVCAHPQALAQCQAWLSAHLPGVERRAVSSNAEGARLASEDPSMAAIASARAASLFGLHVIEPAIQDVANNRTRFAIVSLPGRAAEETVLDPGVRAATSLIVSVPNRSGAVHDLLVPLKIHHVSLTRFESRPARSGQWEYFFYMDIEGHPGMPQVAEVLRELRSICTFFKVLGSYPVSGEAT